jgi:small subunit ribosomal protein S18
MGRGSSRKPAKDAAKKQKKKVCVFCRERVAWVDYKDINLLRRFMSDRGKIRARRVSGNCDQHQREVAVAIKTARELALLPYTQRMTTERSRSSRSERANASPEQAVVASLLEDGEGEEDERAQGAGFELTTVEDIFESEEDEGA